MNLAFTLEIEVDPAAWGEEYDVHGAAAVKADVTTYLRSLITESYAGQEGLLSGVEVVRTIERRG